MQGNWFVSFHHPQLCQLDSVPGMAAVAGSAAGVLEGRHAWQAGPNASLLCLPEGARYTWPAALSRAK